MLVLHESRTNNVASGYVRQRYDNQVFNRVRQLITADPCDILVSLPRHFDAARSVSTHYHCPVREHFGHRNVSGRPEQSDCARQPAHGNMRVEYRWHRSSVPTVQSVRSIDSRNRRRDKQPVLRQLSYPANTVSGRSIFRQCERLSSTRRVHRLGAVNRHSATILGA